VNDALAWHRRELAKVQHERDQLKVENTALRAEILRLQAHERAAYRADL
jgi:hypothetical protein